MIATTKPVVNGISPSDAHRGLGDNGGPPIEPLTGKAKLARIQELLERTDVTAAQKCIGIAIVVLAAKDGMTAIGTRELQTCASARDRETVFRATKKLQDLEIIRKESERGQGGRYRVLPQRVVDSIVEAYEEHKSDLVKADRIEDDPPDGSHLTSRPTSTPTSQARAVGSHPTTAPSAPRARARIVSPSGINISQEKQTTTTTVESEAARSSGLDFDALNGSAVDLIAFIAKHTSTDQQSAARMLQTNIRAFTAEAMLEAFSVTLAEMATGVVATPYKYLMETARKMKSKARPALPADQSEAEVKTKRAWERKVIEEALQEGKRK